jgi:hypothetical protein
MNRAPFLFLTITFTLASCGQRQQAKDGYGYRLGDMVKGKEFRDSYDGKSFHLDQFPDSIASEYMRRTDEDNRYDILDAIVKERSPNAAEIPPSNLLVIHLRIGDVIDKTPYAVKEFLSRYVMHPLGTNYVKPLSYYQKVAEMMRARKLKAVTLIGGFHADLKSYKRSLHYVDEIKKFFISEGFSVATRINQPADEDFVYFCNASYFTPGGGGFSHLVQEILKLRGKEIILPKITQ